ncbi:hypothetical protein LK996_08390 [Lysobacter sp. A6]|uniref:Protein kinase domain-containing protein n=1 Tax=Noviluteimonas lactosilytica TaxID=2888523 RepID=A0ABS8JHQ0_9GAMM|nr:hypothetical protein [Lysobacter lactosilyticus]MCC8363092.1 hypothetical protein [Lysobacter lactosilyticus]
MNDRTGEALFDDARRRHTLAKLVKSGGAGSVYLLRESPHLVAKLYHPAIDHATYARKVAAMLRLSPDLPDIVEGASRRVQIAWPTSLLHDRHGRFVGFLMPAVDVQATCELELILQEKQARAEQLPTGLGPKITLAANLAAVVAALHAQHHYIVDLKPVNLRFHRQSLHMAMLDCDGFSIQGEGERFPAPQFTPDYLAPEFQRGGITTDGEQAQDRFALAVVIFQLLNFGIHPFTGRPIATNVPTDIPSRIAGRWYAYGVRSNASIAPNPGSGHARMPSELRAMFDRAFESRGFGRPAAHEWQALLESFARRSTGRMVVCSRDAVHQHYAGMECAHCERVQLLRRARAAQPARSPTATTPHTRRPTARPNVRPTAPNRATYQARKHSAIPKPNFPRRYQPLPYTPWPPPPGPFARALRKLGEMLILGALGIVIAISLKACQTGSYNPWTQVPAVGGTRTATVPARPAPVQRARAHAPPVEDTPYTPPFESIVGSTDWIYAYVVAAADYDGDLARQVEFLRARGAGQPAPDDRAGASAKALIDTYARGIDARGANMTVHNEAREQLRRGLEHLLRESPYTASVAFELGWMAMLDDNIALASGYFKHAIAVAPADPSGWYGWGVIAPRVEDAYGALSLAEALATDEARMHELRTRFPVAMMPIIGLDEDRFAVVSARARVRGAALTNAAVPADIKALAARPVPR